MGKKASSFEYGNRDISWLSFNERVLQEAADPGVPLVERMRFLGIFSNNLDEFFRVRVASLGRMLQLRNDELPVLEQNPDQTLDRIHELVTEQQSKFNSIYLDLKLAFKKKGIEILTHKNLSVTQERFAKKYFYDKVRPRLVPIILSKKTHFPELKDSQIYFAIRLIFIDGHEEYAVMEIPSDLPRFVILPDFKGVKSLIYLDDIIRLKLRKVFSIFPVRRVEAYTIKTSRDAELDLDDDIDQGILEKLATGVQRRMQGEYVRFLYDQRMPDHMVEYFTHKMGITDQANVIPGAKYHNKRDLLKFPEFGMPSLVYKKQPPMQHEALSGVDSVMQQITDDGLLIHPPFQDFNYIVDLLREAAIDPKVTKIRITLYRVATNSRIVNALINAARNGKKVIVVMKLQARFDEENNIHWSTHLQAAGAKMIFGVPGLKVHSKLICITRKKKKKTTRYACIGTGNFHEGNAKIYTDMFLLTKDSKLTKEVQKVFNFFESNYERGVFRELLISPFNVRRRFQTLIQNEIRAAKAGKRSWIKIKLNNLVDVGMIALLYKASQAGVKVHLVVRGTCAVLPGIPGMSDNIRVVSIVGRYLEHSRLAIFYNGGDSQYYISSADWMTRNLDHRVEVTCPIKNPEHQKELDLMMDLWLRDNVKARIVDKKLENQYVKVIKAKGDVDSQKEIYEYFRSKIV